ncbi:MAG: hypothetical protein U1E51_00630 [Candidatus Binatia bacterium]|nr:hypothetical protein [Candidatus Binatia bacterium]
MYNITIIHFRDIFGKLLWVELIQDEYRLYSPGEGFVLDEVRYRVERVALAENTQHVNVSVVAEDINVVEPYL